MRNRLVGPTVPFEILTELCMNAECENIVLPQLPALANERI